MSSGTLHLCQAPKTVLSHVVLILFSLLSPHYKIELQKKRKTEKPEQNCKFIYMYVHDSQQYVQERMGRPQHILALQEHNLQQKLRRPETSENVKKYINLNNYKIGNNYTINLVFKML